MDFILIPWSRCHVNGFSHTYHFFNKSNFFLALLRNLPFPLCRRDLAMLDEEVGFCIFCIVLLQVLLSVRQRIASAARR